MIFLHIVLGFYWKKKYFLAFLFRFLKGMTKVLPSNNAFPKHSLICFVISTKHSSLDQPLSAARLHTKRSKLQPTGCWQGPISNSECSAQFRHFSHSAPSILQNFIQQPSSSHRDPRRADGRFNFPTRNNFHFEFMQTTRKTKNGFPSFFVRMSSLIEFQNRRNRARHENWLTKKRIGIQSFACSYFHHWDGGCCFWRFSALV